MVSVESPPLSVGVVVITRDRCPELLDTLDELLPLLRSGEVAEVVVVDNASSDATAHAVSALFPEVVLLRQTADLGAAGRTVGAEALATDLVAFADDDSWWEPGALSRAAEVFAETPELGLLHARLVVEPEGRTDPVCERLARGPLDPGAPGPAVAGHLACAVVLRREVFVGLGGYHPALGVGGEERLLSLDLAAECWAQAYVPEVVAHHLPSTSRESRARRRARSRRNDVLTSLLRLPARRALAAAAGLVADVPQDPALLAEVPALVRALPRVRAERRVLPASALRRLDVIDRLSRVEVPQVPDPAPTPPARVPA